MAGSQLAAETSNGKAVAARGNRLRRFFVLGGFIASGALAACSTPRALPAAPAAAAADVSATPELSPAPAQPAAMRTPELPVLTGMDPAQVTALLGEPDLRRREPPAELWQYRSADCVLDVFLYADGGHYHVMQSETRNRHSAQPMVTGCAAAFDRQSRLNRL